MLVLVEAIEDPEAAPMYDLNTSCSNCACLAAWTAMADWLPPVRLEICANWDRWDEVMPKLAKLAGDKLAMVEVYAARFARSDSWRPQKAAMSFAVMFGKAEDIANRELNWTIRC